MTVRTYSCIPADPKKTLQDWSEILWRTDNLHSLETAQEKWGIMQWHAPPLSASSAIEHAPLKYIRVMQLPELQREEKSYCSADDARKLDLVVLARSGASAQVG